MSSKKITGLLGMNGHIPAVSAPNSKIKMANELL